MVGWGGRNPRENNCVAKRSSRSSPKYGGTGVSYLKPVTTGSSPSRHRSSPLFRSMLTPRQSEVGLRGIWRGRGRGLPQGQAVQDALSTVPFGDSAAHCRSPGLAREGPPALTLSPKTIVLEGDACGRVRVRHDRGLRAFVKPCLYGVCHFEVLSRCLLHRATVLDRCAVQPDVSGRALEYPRQDGGPHGSGRKFLAQVLVDLCRFVLEAPDSDAPSECGVDRPGGRRDRRVPRHEG